MWHWLKGMLFLVELVHSDVYACKDEGLDTLYSIVEDREQGGHLLIVKTSEDIVYLPATQELIAYAKSETCVFLSYELLDMPKSVMSSVRATALETHLPKRKSQLVDDDEEPLGVNILLL